jgi:[protein-PII] uridylyltransferase
VVENKSALKQIRSRLLNSALKGRHFALAYTDECDKYLSFLFENSIGKDTKEIALLALGSYANGLLCPYSDLDITVIYKKTVPNIAERIYYPLWDQGIKLDYSTRTPKEALGLLKSDFKVALGLAGARFVAGDKEYFKDFMSNVKEAVKKEFENKARELKEFIGQRHEKYGELYFLLEPNLKESKGGIRDYVILKILDDLLGSSNSLREIDILIDTRVELHRTTERATDFLYLQEQDKIAERLNFVSADTLMTSIVGASRNIAFYLDFCLKELSGLKRKKTRVIKLDDSIFINENGEISALPEILGDPATCLKLACASLEYSKDIDSTTLADISWQIPERVRWNSEMKDLFLKLLAGGHLGKDVLEKLDRYNILEKYLYFWPEVQNKVQRNALHKYTVDRHLLETAAWGADFLRDVTRPDLLLLSCLLHDVGKGSEGDHSKTGAQIAHRFLKEMGYSSQDAEIVARIVENHLLLADTATRRDLADQATIDYVASKISDLETLEILALLSEADALATSEKAWSPWKKSLIGQLVSAVKAKLAGSEIEFQDFDETPLDTNLIGKVTLLKEGDKIKVIAPDRRGLLAATAGVLYIHGADVRRAHARSATPNMVSDTFEISYRYGREPDWNRVKEDLIKSLNDPDFIESNIERQKHSYEKFARKKVYAEPKVIIDNEASNTASVLEIRASDRHGLLYYLAKAVLEAELDIRSAHVDTLGHEVVDVFYILKDGKKPESSQMLELKQKIEDLLKER